MYHVGRGRNAFATRGGESSSKAAVKEASITSKFLACSVMREVSSDASVSAGKTLPWHRWLEAVCSDPIEHRRRIETRSSDIVGLALPDWNAVAARAYDKWNRDRLVIDAAHRNLEVCVDDALDLLRR